MKSFLNLFAVAAFGLMLYGCNREQQAEAPQPQSPPSVAAAPTPPPAVAPAPIPPATELALNSVDSVMLSRPADAPAAIIIHVSGTAVSPGWTEAKLAEDVEGESDSTIKTYKFVAISPETPIDKRVSEPVETELRVESLPPEVMTIRIVAATNDLSVPIAQ